jgi:hypothetical protein
MCNTYHVFTGDSEVFEDHVAIVFGIETEFGAHFSYLKARRLQKFVSLQRANLCNEELHTIIVSIDDQASTDHRVSGNFA